MVCYSLRMVTGDGSNQLITFWLFTISYVTAVGTRTQVPAAHLEILVGDDGT